MLRDGEFIKEPPIRIGAHYVPFKQNSVSSEEEFVQNLMLHGTPTIPMGSTRISKIIDMFIFVLMIWVGVAIIVPVAKLILDYLL